MNLYIVRHAIAEQQAPDGSGDDSARPLSERGVRRFRQVAGGLKKLGIRFETLYHSPKLRAVQTANELAGLVQGKTEVTPTLAKRPGKELLALLDRFSQGEEVAVAVVGHEPYLSELCAWLVTGDRAQARAFLFKKGGTAILEGTPRPGQMQLSALLPPRITKRL